uniref:Zinc finger GRF-type domain-containing protein n=1 Tax=Oryza brachyantha TaxID=4533 RepID=J3MS96_ORYBR
MDAKGGSAHFAFTPLLARSRPPLELLGSRRWEINPNSGVRSEARVLAIAGGVLVWAEDLVSFLLLAEERGGGRKRKRACCAVAAFRGEDRRPFCPLLIRTERAGFGEARAATTTPTTSLPLSSGAGGALHRIPALRLPLARASESLRHPPAEERCGAAVVESRSIKHGGKFFFKCVENDQDVPDSCNFFKWVDSYRKMVEGMTVQSIDEASSDVALEHFVAGPKENKLRVDDGKMDKLINLIQVLVMINICLLVVCFIGVFVMILK